jgi:phosphoenolpyruvate carboxykinase (ATP)
MLNVLTLSKEKEPQIWNAIRFGSILENINFMKTLQRLILLIFTKTENTRVSYPIEQLIDTML